MFKSHSNVKCIMPESSDCLNLQKEQTMHLFVFCFGGAIGVERLKNISQFLFKSVHMGMLYHHIAIQFIKKKLPPYSCLMFKGTKLLTIDIFF